ncbi:MAG: GntR family transcriptional regulator, partial [Deltaproteobacteria bacterium]|nr:GntR family transcriptional regulator [Deltaproteobacteria bacterium]
MSFEKVSYRSLSDDVHEILKRKILRCELKQGQRLKDKEIAQALGVSRSLVRNVLTILEKEGLVRFSRKGVFVAQYTRREIQEIFEVRGLLESFALESAVENISQREIDEIHEQIERARAGLEKGRVEECLDLDMALHRLIIRKSSNSQIEKIYSTYRSMLQIIAFSDRNHMGEIRQAFEEHCRLFEAIERRDLVRSKKVLRAHLSSAMRSVLRNFPPTLDPKGGEEEVA